MLKRALIAVAVLALFLTGCGRLSNEAGEPADEETGRVPSALQDQPVDPGAGFDAGIAVNWDNPIDGVAMESTADASQAVSFNVHEPRSLGSPISVYVSSAEVPKDSRVIAFVYDTGEFGRVAVLEHVPETPVEQYEKFHEYLASLNGDPLVHGRFDLVSIRSGEQALVTTSADGTLSSAFWLEEGVEFIVEGPTLSFEDAVKIAEAV